MLCFRFFSTFDPGEMMREMDREIDFDCIRWILFQCSLDPFYVFDSKRFVLMEHYFFRPIELVTLARWKRRFPKSDFLIRHWRELDLVS